MPIKKFDPTRPWHRRQKARHQAVLRGDFLHSHRCFTFLELLAAGVIYPALPAYSTAADLAARIPAARAYSSVKMKEQPRTASMMTSEELQKHRTPRLSFVKRILNKIFGKFAHRHAHY